MDSDFILEADIVGYNHRWNDFYGLTFRHQEGGGHYAVVWQDVRGSGCGMYNGQLDTGLSLVKTSSISNNGRMDDGVTLAKLNIGSWSEGQYWNLKIEMKGNTIIVYINGVEILRYTDSNPYKDGNYGIVSVSHGKGRFKNIKVITGSRKSLGEAITDVAWRDNSTRFVVYGEDTVPEYMVNKNNVDYQYTVAKLLNSNAYLINLGKNGVNNVVLNELIKDISTATETKGTFINNTPIISAMDSACNWIINLVKNRYKPTGWILVNEPVVWLTKYNDSEHDVPLNFGEHDGNDKFNDSADITISNAWGIGLTNLFTQDKIMAEKWRFRHNWTYYDNPTYEETFHDIWISDPVDIFPNPGLYRINYKRKDNPFYSDVLLTNPFDEYRYWSEDYDPVVSK